MFNVPIFNFKRPILKYSSCLSVFLYLIELVNFAMMAYLYILLFHIETGNNSCIYRITDSHHKDHGSNQYLISSIDGTINCSSVNCRLVLYFFKNLYTFLSCFVVTIFLITFPAVWIMVLHAHVEINLKVLYTFEIIWYAEAFQTFSWWNNVLIGWMIPTPPFLAQSILKQHKISKIWNLK